MQWFINVGKITSVCGCGRLHINSSWNLHFTFISFQGIKQPIQNWMHVACWLTYRECHQCPDQSTAPTTLENPHWGGAFKLKCSQPLNAVTHYCKATWERGYCGDDTNKFIFILHIFLLWDIKNITRPDSHFKARTIHWCGSKPAVTWARCHLPTPGAETGLSPPQSVKR